MRDRITEDHLKRYLDLTGKALERLSVAAPNRSFGRRLAEDFLEMANSYYSDAKHFMEKQDFVNAFACINYSHGWLDCGARLGLFDVGGDDQLFTLFE
ncbi:MAG: DUF357 domain-containing protein [Methanomassiliicoccales archaeon]|nr:DUF357 domain-containing protein [Methanomassiliicoccales archaeon]NYT14843.1 DUF357 domain-containing protein [Methanomassiliicoccales archaeon]